MEKETEDGELARTSYLGKIILGDPSVPVVLQCSLCGTAILVLAESPLVHDTVIASRVEQRRGDEWLEH